MKQFFFLCLIAAIVFACNNAVHEQPADHAEKTAGDIDIVQSKSYDTIEVRVELDNGKKWVANKETTEGVTNMRKIISQAIVAGSRPHQTTAALKKEFKTIFDKCTMKGEAHEQLHNFLIPVKKQLDEIAQPGNTTQKLNELHTYLVNYEQYFK